MLFLPRPLSALIHYPLLNSLHTTPTYYYSKNTITCHQPSILDTPGWCTLYRQTDGIDIDLALTSEQRLIPPRPTAQRTQRSPLSMWNRCVDRLADCWSRGLDCLADCWSRGLDCLADCWSRGLDCLADCWSRGLDCLADCWSRGLDCLADSWIRGLDCLADCWTSSSFSWTGFVSTELKGLLCRSRIPL